MILAWAERDNHLVILPKSRLRTYSDRIIDRTTENWELRMLLPEEYQQSTVIEIPPPLPRIRRHALTPPEQTITTEQIRSQFAHTSRQQRAHETQTFTTNELYLPPRQSTLKQLNLNTRLSMLTITSQNDSIAPRNINTSQNTQTPSQTVNTSQQLPQQQALSGQQPPPLSQPPQQPPQQQIDLHDLFQPIEVERITEQDDVRHRMNPKNQPSCKLLKDSNHFTGNGQNGNVSIKFLHIMQFELFCKEKSNIKLSKQFLISIMSSNFLIGTTANTFGSDYGKF